MKITSITVYQADLPLEFPYWLSAGRLKFEVLDATFVKIENIRHYTSCFRILVMLFKLS